MNINITKATSPPMIVDMVFGGMILASKERVRVSLSFGDNSMKIWSGLNRFGLIETSFAEQAQNLLQLSSPIPWKILSATHGAGVLTPGWNLADPVTLPEESRFFVVDVAFASPFASPPVVHLGLTGFDID